MPYCTPTKAIWTPRVTPPLPPTRIAAIIPPRPVAHADRRRPRFAGPARRSDRPDPHRCANRQAAGRGDHRRVRPDGRRLARSGQCDNDGILRRDGGRHGDCAPVVRTVQPVREIALHRRSRRRRFPLFDRDASEIDYGFWRGYAKLDHEAITPSMAAGAEPLSGLRGWIVGPADRNRHRSGVKR